MRLNLHVQTYKQTLIIAAISSRPYVKAAVLAGYDVIAIDGFADVDTQCLAKAAYKVGVQDGKIDALELQNLLPTLNSQHVAGFCYGAGFEKQPVLIDSITKQLTVFGNTGEVVRQCKNPSQFFQHCDALSIPYPEVTLNKPEGINGWIQKIIGESSGAHINPPSAYDDRTDAYYQRFQDGRAISCLFLAIKGDVEIVGFNEMWPDSLGTMAPFRYGGAASHINISDQARTAFEESVRKLAGSLALVGLNSCDAILDGDEAYILEVNPRLSATIDLYLEAQPDLMSRHIQAQTRSVKNAVESTQTSVAHQIVYADVDMTIEQGFSWPEWAVDIPAEGSEIKIGMPVCTVLGRASVARQAKSLVQERVMALKDRFLN